MNYVTQDYHIEYEKLPTETKLDKLRALYLKRKQGKK